MINNYNENVRKEIAIEFGLEAGGYAPTPTPVPALTVAQAQYLNAKYPSEFLSMRPSAKASLIAKRYGSLKVKWANN
jgi:hypothetical protein